MLYCKTVTLFFWLPIAVFRRLCSADGMGSVLTVLGARPADVMLAVFMKFCRRLFTTCDQQKIGTDQLSASRLAGDQYETVRFLATV